MGRSIIGDKIAFQCAGINRHEAEDERALRERSSDPLGLESCAATAMGRFYHDNMVWTLSFSGWGLATGIGLLRALRWACISTLIFSGLLAVLGIVVFLLMPGGDVSGWTLILLRTASTLLFLIPIAVGLRWLFFFSRKEVKAYFQTGLQAHRQSAPRG